MLFEVGILLCFDLNFSKLKQYVSGSKFLLIFFLSINKNLDHFIKTPGVVIKLFNQLVSHPIHN